MKYWNEQGFIPPVLDRNPAGKFRSPYSISLLDFYNLFSCISAERLQLLNNFLQYREHLHTAGVVNGEQWINGSFLINIEKIDGRAPRDIDIVTFIYSYDSQNEEKISDFMQSDIADSLKIDAYYLDYQGESPEVVIAQTTYWHSLWSQMRGNDGQWKGYLKINMNPQEDQDLRNYLNGGKNEH